MKEMLKQLSSAFGAVFAAACCLGLPLVLTAVGAAGLGFILNDAILWPLFSAFVILNLLLLHRSTRQHGQAGLFYIGLAGGLLAMIGLGLLVTGTYAANWSIYIGLGLLVLASIMDFLKGRKLQKDTGSCEIPVKIGTTETAVDNNRRLLNGTAIAATSAVVFYGMYKAVAILAPPAQAGEIACYGINSCKGKSSCSTANNACSGQNSCKGKGFINVPLKDCYAKGGIPLKGSKYDPAN